jgi:hypothetical protein
MGKKKNERKYDGKRTGTKRLRWRARKGRKRVLTGKVRKQNGNKPGEKMKKMLHGSMERKKNVRTERKGIKEECKIGQEK